MQADPNVFEYRVDAENCLVSVGSNWNRFAQDNAAPNLGAEAIVGCSLFDFLSDRETEHIYGLLLARVRTGGRTLVVPFRCDGPAVRRFMQLTISPGPDGEVRFESRILREEARESVPLLEPEVERSDEVVVLCSWCKKVDVEGDWLEVEAAVDRLGLFDSHELPRISHGCCPACAAGFLDA